MDVVLDAADGEQMALERSRLADDGRIQARLDLWRDERQPAVRGPYEMHKQLCPGVAHGEDYLYAKQIYIGQ